MQMNDAQARTIAKIVALLALIGAVAVLLSQADVSDGTVGATRPCGSALDSAIDRSGWDAWWASDLDEPDPVVGSALVRTRNCPDAINVRLAIAAALGVVGVVSALAARGRGDARGRADAPTTLGERVTRLGRASTWVGLSLSAAGVVAVVVLVGDADSTLFLYTDRLVVAVVGLLVLTPTIALFVIGRVLAMLGAHLDGDAAPHDPMPHDADPEAPDG
ncbi:MAG: hypothetical protein HKN44_13090 [Ilumatobacter sp.]|nr:hypothetical protein [Ilumatobacter sp.]